MSNFIFNFNIFMGLKINPFLVIKEKTHLYLPYMLYLKIHNRYQHVLGTKMSIMTNFRFNFNTFMGLKINAFRVIKEKHILVGGYLGF